MKELLKLEPDLPELACANLHPYLDPRLKNEKSCTSALPLGLQGLLQGDLYLYIPTFRHKHPVIKFKRMR
jgi:hypothetical protein